jgi:rubrerythrin
MKTIDNLNAARSGEANACHRYTIFASKAEAEGHAWVARLFRAAAYAEGLHRDGHQAAIIKLGGKPNALTLDEVKIGTTRENLAVAIQGEIHERDEMYPEFLKVAEAEGASVAVRTMRYALAAETEHARLYQAALDNLGRNQDTPIFVCPVCGYTVTVLPEEKCPPCGVKKEKFIKF